MRWFVPALLLAGCAPNKPPRVYYINDRVVDDKLFRQLEKEGERPIPPAWVIAPGERFEIVVDAEDPEGQPMTYWYLNPPPGFETYPEDNTAVWNVPFDYEEITWEMKLIVSDEDEDEPRYGIGYLFFALFGAEGQFEFGDF